MAYVSKEPAGSLLLELERISRPFALAVRHILRSMQSGFRNLRHVIATHSLPDLKASFDDLRSTPLLRDIADSLAIAANEIKSVADCLRRQAGPLFQIVAGASLVATPALGIAEVGAFFGLGAGAGALLCLLLLCAGILIMYHGMQKLTYPGLA